MTAAALVVELLLQIQDTPGAAKTASTFRQYPRGSLRLARRARCPSLVRSPIRRSLCFPFSFFSYDRERCGAAPETAAAASARVLGLGEDGSPPSLTRGAARSVRTAAPEQKGVNHPGKICSQNKKARGTGRDDSHPNSRGLGSPLGFISSEGLV
jgi:hypothetical protein